MFRAKQVLLAILMPFCLLSDAFALGASGLTTQMIGVKALGQGNAFAAQADDPTAIFYNPAGITQLSGTQLSVGSTLLVAMSERTGAGVPDDKMKEELSVLPSFFLTHTMDMESRLSFGVGVHMPYGLTTEWAPTSSVRYTTTKSAFEMLDVNPTVAFQVSPKLSFGLGANYVNLFNTVSEAMINQGALVPGAADGTSRLSGHGEGWGYNAGALFKPLERHSFGFSYRSEVRVPIKGSVELSNLDPGVQGYFNFPGSSYAADATSSFIFPKSALVGYSYAPNERWRFVADYEWTQWNVFQSQDVAIEESDPNRLSLLTGNPDSNVTSTPRHWRNVSAIGGGASYKLSDAWQFRGGYAYYQRTAPNETFSPDIPDSSIHILTLGFSRSWQKVVFDFAVNNYFYPERNIDNTVGNNVGGSVDGTYKTFIPVIALSVTYKFGK